jgi:hypothetical protein
MATWPHQRIRVFIEQTPCEEVEVVEPILDQVHPDEKALLHQLFEAGQRLEMVLIHPPSFMEDLIDTAEYSSSEQRLRVFVDETIAPSLITHEYTHFLQQQSKRLCFNEDGSIVWEGQRYPYLDNRVADWRAYFSQPWEQEATLAQMKWLIQQGDAFYEECMNRLFD